MSNKRRVLQMLAGLLLLPVLATAQVSSVNSFSPYTFYGIGDINAQGSNYFRAMGGVGVAFHSPLVINSLNPASLSSGLQRSFMMGMGLEGSVNKLKTSSAESTYNTFNVRDMAVQFPVSNKIGFGVSVTPFSSVGYMISREETNPDIIADLGQVKYLYSGEGGVAQIKAGLGYQLTERLSVGAEAVYYLGSIDRSFDITINPVIGEGTYNNILSTNTDKVSKIYGNFGVQYDILKNEDHLLTFGATYQPGGKLNNKITRFIPSGNLTSDTVFISTIKTDFKMASTLTAGMFLHTSKFGVGLDYTYQNWGINNAASIDDDVEYINTQSIKFGFQYTPNRLDVRRVMNRWTYRAGLRYSDYYLKIHGERMNDKAVTLGLGIPIKVIGMSSVNIGMEFGTRGTINSGLIKENYFRFSVGFNLFGEDYWFVKRKYD